MNHEHKVQFPQVEEVKKHAQQYQQFYIGLAVGLCLGYLKGRSCAAKEVRVFFTS